MSATRLPAQDAPAPRALDPERLRADFPALHRRVHGHPYTYLDSAATSQRPRSVIRAVDAYYRRTNANIHRGVYAAAEEATALYEGARDRIAALLDVDRSEVIYTRNATEGLNLVAYAYGEGHVGPNDAVLVTESEHHSNLLPWQRLCERRGARLEVLPVTDRGELDLSELDAVLARGVRIVALSHVSNVLGVENPVAYVAERAHRAGAVVVVDAAQSVPHMPVRPRALGADFLAFSGHKMLGPTGIGVLWGRRELLEAMPPFLTGGDMVGTVHLRRATWAELPHKFEAGTPAIAEAIGLGAAVEYLTALDLRAVAEHSRTLAMHAAERLAELPRVTVYGPPPGAARTAVVAFNVAGVHPHDLATILDGQGVAIRAGHHCAQPLMERYGVAAMARASVYVYNRDQDLERLVAAVRRAQDVFGGA
ncbi:MAG: SufS family cysteine desulfurase [Firmicutes bacterium]|nr:SufS family cysteine desulfurase [Bacillota bacterium]